MLLLPHHSNTLGMLQPLDPRRLEALARGDECKRHLDFDPTDRIGILRRELTEDEDFATGVSFLLRGWPVFLPYIVRKTPWYDHQRKGVDDWTIKFLVSAPRGSTMANAVPDL